LETKQINFEIFKQLVLDVRTELMQPSPRRSKKRQYPKFRDESDEGEGVEAQYEFGQSFAVIFSAFSVQLTC
jgi:hypothetical protein